MNEYQIITDLESIRELIVLYCKKHNISDPNRIEKFIKVNNKKLESKQIHCMTYKKDKFLGFIIGYYFNKNKCFEVSNFYFNHEEKNDFICSTELINQFSKHFLNLETNFFRIKLDYDVEKELITELNKKGFNDFLRYEMGLKLSGSYEPAKLPKGYEFIDYDINKYFEDREVRMNSYNNNIDSEIFPEVFRMREIVEDDIEDYSISPQIIHGDKLVASSDVQAVSNKIICIDNLSVLQEHQEKGLGRKLMEEIIYRCNKKGYELIALDVTVENHNALKLYKKLGFDLDHKFYFFIKHFRK